MKLGTKYWDATTSFYAVETSSTAASLAASIKGAIEPSADIVLVRAMDFERGIYSRGEPRQRYLRPDALPEERLMHRDWHTEGSCQGQHGAGAALDVVGVSYAIERLRSGDG